MSTLNVLASLIASLATSSIVGVLFLAFARRLLESRFDVYLETLKAKHAEQLAALSAQLEGDREALRKMAHERMSAYPIISEVAYRAKSVLCNRIDAVIVSTHGWDVECEQLGVDATRYADALAETCFKYRFLLSDDQFSLLHRYKQTVNVIQTVLAVERQLRDRTLTLRSLRNCRDTLEGDLAPLVRHLQGDASHKPNGLLPRH